MKKVLLITGLVVLLGTTAQAATTDVAQGMEEKFVRGVKNFFTSIVEVPMQIRKGYVNGVDAIEHEPCSKVVGTVLGFFRGFSHAGGRFTWGALEMFGFWTANPPDNIGVGIPLDAENAWEWGDQYSIFDPSLEEGIKPIGRKLGHGLANGFLGILEVPGQTIQGADEGNAVKGLGKGIWFAFSRGAYGLTGIMSALVPNPEDNPGYAWDDEYPWDSLQN